MAKAYYVLGGNAGSFYDPTQPVLEDQNLSYGQVKELEETERVNASRKAEGLIRLTESEAKKLIAENAAKQSSSSSTSTVDLGLVESNKALAAEIEALKAKNEDAEVSLRQAQIKLKDSDVLQTINEDLEKSNKALSAEIEALKKAKKV